MNDALLSAKKITTGYHKKVILSNVTLTIPTHKISVIIGANGCGKSTLLKSFARLLLPFQGTIQLNDKNISTYSGRFVAQTLGLLPQSPIVPEGITVAELVARGRFPYRKLLKNMTDEDYQIVSDALDAVGITNLANASVDELSGGQRQRVWIALALAQQTDILLLDEPTTFLDISHQIEILDLLIDLNKKCNTTIVMVLHDINLSARYADYLFAMKQGVLVAHGEPKEIITEELIKELYDLDCLILEDPIAKTPYILPKGRHHNTVPFSAFKKQSIS